MNNTIVDKCKELIVQTADDEVDLRKLGSHIAGQNEILSEVLKKVNSIEFGLDYRIDDPSHATAILGQRKLAEILEGVIEVQERLTSDKIRLTKKIEANAKNEESDGRDSAKDELQS